ncbi:MAG TPA: PEP-CTERM-box response regulator transcription factor [Deltaproteobacteria bacterium]|nr:PEP-CTERM-box response regulator transcription factor [Deltaproteobacteria bacterium]
MKDVILIVEDETSMAKQLKWGLSDTYEVVTAGDAQSAKEAIQTQAPRVMILDLGLPPLPDSAEVGLGLLEEVTRERPEMKVVVITGNTQKDSAVRAVSLGAYDFHTKPVDLEELRIVIKRALHLSRLERQVREYERVACEEPSFHGMVASSACMMDLFERARKVARTDYPVLIQGESGTGKERLARAIHAMSDRCSRPIVIIDCGAIPENLIESELFGHEKGSFTGAHARQIGKVERAQGGTVVLDEVGELPLPLQVKLLRFIQEGTIERIGGRETLRVDARLIAVTNVNLKKAVEEKRFREDLFYRLNVVPLTVPALRERPEDIPLLARFFLDTYSREIGPRFKGFSRSAMDAMMRHPWQGNVREMQNRIRRAVVMAEGDYIQCADLDLKDGGDGLQGGARTLREARDAAEIAAIRDALARHGGNISRAALELDVSRPTLHDLIRKHGIQVTR